METEIQPDGLPWPAAAPGGSATVRAATRAADETADGVDQVCGQADDTDKACQQQFHASNSNKMQSLNLSGDKVSKKATAFASLAQRCHTLQLKQLMQHAQSPQVMEEAFTITEGLPAGVMDYARGQLPGVPENVVVLAVALCSYRRGAGGRQNGPDPRKTPGISPKKAARILANRHSALASKIKKKLVRWAEQATCQPSQQPCKPGTPQNTAAATAAPVVPAALPSANTAPAVHVEAAAAAAAPAAMDAVMAWQAAATAGAATAAEPAPGAAAAAAEPAAGAAAPAAAVTGNHKQQFQAEIAQAVAAGLDEMLFGSISGHTTEPPPGEESMDWADVLAEDPSATSTAAAQLPQQQQQLAVPGMQAAPIANGSSLWQLSPDTATASAATGASMSQGLAVSNSSSSLGRAPSGQLVRAMQLGHLQRVLLGQDGQLLQFPSGSMMAPQQQQQAPMAGSRYDPRAAQVAAATISAPNARAGPAPPAAPPGSAAAGASAGALHPAIVATVNPQVSLPGVASSEPVQQDSCLDAAFDRLAGLQWQLQLSRSNAGRNHGQQDALLSGVMDLVGNMLESFKQQEQQEQQLQQCPHPQAASPHAAPYSSAQGVVPDAGAGAYCCAPLAMHAAATAATGHPVTASMYAPAALVPATRETCAALATGMQQPSSNPAMVLGAVRNTLVDCLLQLQQMLPIAAAAGPSSMLPLQDMSSSTVPVGLTAAVAAPAHQVAANTAHNGQPGYAMMAHPHQQQQQQVFMAQAPQPMIQGLQLAAGPVGLLPVLHGGHAADMVAAFNDGGVAGNAANGAQPLGGLGVDEPNTELLYDDDLIARLLDRGMLA